jgi:Zn-dependent M28 family amino/carboxypeptidase
MRRALWAYAVCLALLVPAAAQAKTFDSTAYRNKVTVANMMTHEQALQDIADANNGTRAAGTSGNEATTDYVLHTMQSAGWQTHKQTFEFPFFNETGPATLEETAPTPTTYTEGTDYALMTYSGAGDKTGTVVPVDVTVPIDPNSDPSTSNSGCEASDFAGFPAGAIALVQRGTCTFGAKAQNAETAGASAIVIFNEGQLGRQDVVQGTLGAPVGIPAIGTSYQLGADTVQRINDGATITWHVVTSTENGTKTTSNVVADSPWGDQDKTVVVSAHNDSVPAGPGINDDGSGTSMDLELARQLGKGGLKPRNHVRFLWVGAEELGLLGSQYYVDHLSSAERSQIIAMLDFDMVASPNWARQVYDGDGSTFGEDVSGPNGSGYIESLFNGWFDSRDQAHEPIPFDGRSDYVAFTNAGIPAGGIFTGAERLKTAEEQAMFGGVEGVALDHCYHQACDDITNVNTTVFGQMKNAAADVLYQLMLTQNPIVDGSSPKHAKRLAGAFRGEQARK